MRRLVRPFIAALAMGALAFAAGAGAQPPAKSATAQPPKDVSPKKKRDFNPNSDNAEPPKKGNPITATDPKSMKVMKDYQVELLYSVPKDQQGSWVNLCHDPKGRLYVSDQYGALYRITPPPKGGDAKTTKIEKVNADIGEAQGLLWAFDALYVVVNSGKRASGLYRVTDKDGDDQLDTVELLRKFEGGGGEHGPHAVLLNPDGKRLTIVCGNQTKLLKFDSTKPAPVWGDDHLLPRMPDGRGFMRGVIGPGGAIYNVNPDGKNWELFAVGFRNEYDAAYNRQGDLFSYDADMEWDFNTPWYRPTRVCYVPAGAEFGWRNGAGKYPAYYADSLPAIDDIGPGSPTGVCFGYGAKFPAKYQDAFFICDWSYGKLYACHIAPKGAGYTCVHEEFVTGTPLPLTDVIINPVDGAMYFTIGGRQTQSGLYRVTYTGSESTELVKTPAKPKDAGFDPAGIRSGLEAELNRPMNANGIQALFGLMGETERADRFLRYEARVALEHQDPKLWAEKALTEKNPAAAIASLMALIRVSAVSPEHLNTEVNKGKPKADPALADKIVKALNAISFPALSEEQRLAMVRDYHVLFARFGKPTEENRLSTIQKLDAVYPTGMRYVDGELAQLLVYLEAPSAAAKTVKLLTAALTQEEQIEYARALRMLKTGWTPELQKEYFQWFVKSESYKGGMSFGGFLKQIKDDAVANLNEKDRIALKPILEAKPVAGAKSALPPRPFVKAYKLDDLIPKLEKGLAGGRDFDRGRKMFAAASCFGCHRFDNEGGSTGPDLTVASGRFSPRDLLESIIDPSKEISDQYAAVEIHTLDGKSVSGRIINLNGDTITLLTNMLDPSSTVNVNRRNIEEQKLSKVSMMPTGALDTLSEDEVMDLLAYVLSRADRTNKMFKK
ncbi:MAG: c-type cytochrome [Gemmataceae bacterium]